MVGSTPTREARSSRLGGKPYDRPASASSSAANTPNKPPKSGGLLRSLVGKLYSPFQARNHEQSTTAKERDDVEDEGGDADERSRNQGSGSGRPANDDDQRMRSDDDYQPIQPILDAVNSLTPITPERSTLLLSTFMADKQALGQAGQQTPEEQQAISELLRRATEDNGGSYVLGLSTASGSSRSPMISRTGRGLFDIPASERSIVRSSSHSVLGGSPIRNRLGQRDALDSPARSWRPLHSSTLGKSQSSASVASPTKSSQQVSGLQPTDGGSSQQTANNRPSQTSFASRQASSLSKSTSMFTMSHRARSEASPDLSRSNGKQADTSAPAAESSSSNPPRQIKSAAARTLENLLSKVEAESDKKLSVEPISNPYEGYRFHIGSSATASSKASSQSASSSSRPRTSLKPRPRPSLAAPAPNTAKMSDLELIEASMNAEQKNKRARKSSPKPTPSGKQVDHTSDSMQVDESPSTSSRTRRTETPQATPRSSYPILARRKSPIKAQLPTSVQSQTTRPNQPPTSKVSAFDIISRTIASSAEPEKTARTSVSFAPIATPKSLPPPPATEKNASSTGTALEKQTPEEIVRKLDASALPVSTFRSLANVVDLGKNTSALARQQALAKSTDQLPTFTFTFKMSNASTPNAAAPPATGFTGWGSGMTPQAASGDMWECSTCNLKSKASSTKCDVCDTPRPAPKPASATPNTGFTGWGAGAQKPTAASDDWKCGACDLMSKATSTKCDVCNTPRPAAAPAPKVASTGFTGWGSGMQEKAKPSGLWKCGLCGCDSKESSTKCDVCSTPR